MDISELKEILLVDSCYSNVPKIALMMVGMASQVSDSDQQSSETGLDIDSALVVLCIDHLLHINPFWCSLRRTQDLCH